MILLWKILLFIWNKFLFYFLAFAQFPHSLNYCLSWITRETSHYLLSTFSKYSCYCQPLFHKLNIVIILQSSFHYPLPPPNAVGIWIGINFNKQITWLKRASFQYSFFRSRELSFLKIHQSCFLHLLNYCLLNLLYYVGSPEAILHASSSHWSYSSLCALSPNS